MAATSHPLATATALDILQRGGNAVDAAIAASATYCIVEPHMTGVGGDCFAIVVEPDGAMHALNGSGRAPASATSERYRTLGHREVPQFGALAVTVPGAVKAWETLLLRFGTRSFEELFATAIRYAQEGFPVYPRVAHDWAGYVDDLRRDPGAAKHLLRDGMAPAAGERFFSPAMGATLRTIARGGADAFYQGGIAAEMAATVKAKGGFLTEEDLSEVAADWVTPISAKFANYDVFELPPSGQGITALLTMRLMQFLGAGDCLPGSVERFHIEIEAARLAYSVRDHFVSDAATMRVQPEALLSDSYIASLARTFNAGRRNRGLLLPPLTNSDTVYLSVVDHDRRAVSFINSVYDGFGSRLVTPTAGFALQNRGACFSLEEGHPNEIAPRKRPMHTIIPAMAMYHGKCAISFGVVGGAFQPLGQAHVLSNMASFGMDPQEALDDARIFWDETGALLAERGISDALRRGLADRGHQVREATGPHGAGQVILIDHESGFLIGGSDPRKDGIALGW